MDCHSLKEEKLDVTFTVTTCRRLNHFIETMESFFKQCIDFSLISTYLLVDDNSSEEDRALMKEKYPFFQFIWKEPSQSGHASSLNIILKEVKTKYVLQWEDDWKIDRPFSVKELVTFLTEKNGFQVKFLNENERSEYLPYVEKGLTYVEAIPFEPIRASASLDVCREMYISFLREIGRDDLAERVERKDYVYTGYWWPGFALNPSLYNILDMRKIGLFLDINEFEFYQGAKAYFLGLKVYVDLTHQCIHIGNDVSAYILNNAIRSYEDINTAVNELLYQVYTNSDEYPVKLLRQLLSQSKSDALSREEVEWLLLGRPGRDLSREERIKLCHERQRLEPLYSVISRLCQRKDPELLSVYEEVKSYFFLPTVATYHPIPQLYSYIFLEKVAVTLYHLGQLSHALKLYLSIVERERNISSEEIRRITNNIRKIWKSLVLKE